MTEHRLIERMFALMEKEVERIRAEKRANFEFIEIAIDFIRTYADRLHHGKEEDILFRDLKAKRLDEHHRKTMEELIEEHRWGRKKVKELVDANINYKEGDENTIEAITRCLQDLVNFYPQHIEKKTSIFSFQWTSFAGGGPYKEERTEI
jgi:hemerythrin-like domain-containing protein